MAKKPVKAKAVPRSVWVAVVVESKNGPLFLLARRSKTANNPGMWNLPGGGIDAGELPAQAAMRELREEMGVRTNHLVKLHVDRGNKTKHLYYFFITLKKRFKPKLNAESDGYKWVTFHDAIKLKLHVPTKLFFLGTPYRQLISS